MSRCEDLCCFFFLTRLSDSKRSSRSTSLASFPPAKAITTSVDSTEALRSELNPNFHHFKHFLSFKKSILTSETQ